VSAIVAWFFAKRSVRASALRLARYMRELPGIIRRRDSS